MAEMRKTECISGLSGSMVLWKSHRGRIRGFGANLRVIDFLPSNQNETRLQFVMKIQNGEESGSFFQSDF